MRAMSCRPALFWRNGTSVTLSSYFAAGSYAALSAARGASGIDVFGFNSGTNNSLLHWPAGIAAADHDPWHNWAGNRQTNPEGHCYPTCLEELVELVRTAAQQNKRARAVGSSWSFSDISVTPGYVIETSKLNKILNTVLPKAGLANPSSFVPPPHHFIHVEAGIQLEKLMEFLDATPEGLTPDDGAEFVRPRIAGWEIDSDTHAMRIVLRSQDPAPRQVRALSI